MGFLSGRLTFARYRVLGRSPGQFGPEHLDALEAHAIGKQRQATADGVEAGWSAGGHLLDTHFDLAKNIVNDTLHFALRVDQQKVPGDLLRAYTQIELDALAADNPSGRPSARQRREARQLARERLENEARDGRFLRRKAYPVLWDSQANELLVGATSDSVVSRLHALFQATFDRSLEALTAGRQAYLQAEVRRQTRSVEDARPAPFLPKLPVAELAWVADEGSQDFAGNEFLLWLWHVLDSESDTLALEDGSEVTVMLARNLVLECPRGQTGRETILSEAPAALPEARRAVQAGKLPRRVGLTLVRHDRQYELTLQAETLAISGARLPPPEETEERAQQEERITLIRHLLETLDLLYDAFGRRRFGPGWDKDLVRMQKWLQEDRRRTAAAG